MPTVKVPSSFRFLYTEHGSCRYRYAYGGRGSGKSHGFAGALVVKSLQQPMRILCCREIQKSIRDSVKRLVDDKIQSSGYGDQFESLDSEIRGKNGSLFLFAGLRNNPDSVKSMEGIDVAWVEEANTVSQRSLDLLIPTVRKPRSEVWFNWNPRYDKDPVDALFRGPHGPPPGSVGGKVNYYDNPWFPSLFRETLEWDQRRDPEKYAHVWLGEYLRNSDARVFKNWTIGVEDPPATARPYFGADFGFSNDPTTLVRVWVWDRKIYIDRVLYRVGLKVDDTPDFFSRVDDGRVSDVRDWPIVADSARPEMIAHMRDHGFPLIESARKGAGSVREGVEFVKSYDVVIHPDCTPAIDEFTLYSYRVDKQTDDVIPELEDKNNHVVDAVRYALEKVRRSQSSEYVTPYVVTSPPDLGNVHAPHLFSG